MEQLSTMTVHNDEEKQGGPLTDRSLPSSEVSDSETIQLDPYGIPLRPQPTSDRLDPLNWSRYQKAIVVFVVCYSGLLAIYMACTPVASFFLLEEQFNASYSQVNWTFAIPSLGLGIGPLIFTSMGDTWGRRPIMILTCAIALIATGCSSIKTISYGGYMFCRFLQGVGAGPCITIGLGMLRDVTFEHERGFKMGLWVMAIDIGGGLGALVGGFTAATGPFWAQYHVVIAFGLLLVLEIFFLPETLYPRELILEIIASDGDISTIRRTKEIKVWNIIKIPGVSHPKPYQSVIRLVKTFTHPRLIFGMIPYVFLQYWWLCSILTMEPAAYENYKVQIQGLFFLGMIIGTVVIEIFASGRLSDWICARLALKNNGIRTPEMRLWLGYPGAVLGMLGCVIWGISIDRQWHWMTGQVAFFLFAAGLQLGNTAVSTYVFDCYPDHILEVMTFWAVVYNLAAFVEPFFINYWVVSVGYTWCFVTQGLITLLLIPCYALVQKFGGRLAKEMKFD